MLVIGHVLIEYHGQIVQFLLFSRHQILVVDYLFFQHVELFSVSF